MHYATKTSPRRRKLKNLISLRYPYCFFFFQAEDGIRDKGM